MDELRFFELLNAREMAIDQRRAGEPPQMLSRLHFWRVGRQDEQA
ncbi:MAG: hypothetical protein ACXWP6_15105 [Ktedonobacterales bacterium]